MDIFSLIALIKAKSGGGGSGGGGSTDGAVLYTSQSLTTNQKSQARENIDAADITSIDRLNITLNNVINDIRTINGQTVQTVAQTFNDVQKARARENIGAYSAADAETALSEKQDELTFDTEPIANSTNPVRSGGIYSALKEKKNIYGNELITVSSGVATASLIPNTIHKCVSSVNNLTITMPLEYGDNDEFIVMFDTDSTTPTVSVPSDITMPNNLIFQNNSHYEINICGDYAAVGRWSLSGEPSK